ncbi:MAG: saccharopine dehydrogenase NADP-binding domain-containing protein, partial [Planctomycetota bacterium]
MRKVLVLGAGMVSRPLVRYLLDLKDCLVTVASLEDAEKVVGDHERGRALTLDVSDLKTLDRLVADHDLA